MKKIIIGFIILLLFTAVPAVWAAPNLSNAFSDMLSKTAGPAGYNKDATPDTLISTIINVALSFLGVIFLILMVYGGYLWMTARGNDQQAEKARDLITAAVIGVIIVAAAYAITWFVMSKISAQTLKGAAGQNIIEAGSSGDNDIGVIYTH